jgi:hypothetical protein
MSSSFSCFSECWAQQVEINRPVLQVDYAVLFLGPEMQTPHHQDGAA